MKIDTHNSFDLRFSSISDINRLIAIDYYRLQSILSNFIDWARREEMDKINKKVKVSILLCGSRKYPYSPHRRDWKFQGGGGGGGVSKTQKFKGMYEAKLEFPEGWGGGSEGKSLLWGGGGGVWIFSGTKHYKEYGEVCLQLLWIFPRFHTVERRNRGWHRGRNPYDPVQGRGDGYSVQSEAHISSMWYEQFAFPLPCNYFMNHYWNFIFPSHSVHLLLFIYFLFYPVLINFALMFLLLTLLLIFRLLLRFCCVWIPSKTQLKQSGRRKNET